MDNRYLSDIAKHWQVSCFRRKRSGIALDYLWRKKLPRKRHAAPDPGHQGQYWNVMSTVIEHEHRRHNDLMVRKFGIKCPGCSQTTRDTWACDQCRVKLCFDVSDVNFINEVRLTDSYPIGRVSLG